VLGPPITRMRWRLHRFANLCRPWLTLIGGLLIFITLTPFDQWYARRLSGGFNDPKGEVLIVLGGSIDDGVLGQSSYLRARYAAWAYHEDGFQYVVISGAGEPVPVAQGMSDLLQAAGVPKRAIILETAARSTLENARNTKSLLEQINGRRVLLTSDYHMFRALRTFRKAGVDVIPRPIPDGVKRGNSFSGRWPAFLDEAAETAKIFYYRGRGWI